MQYLLKLRSLLTSILTCILLLTGTAMAHEINVGRGELPLVIPAHVDASSPAPLIVLLHGYTSSGAGQDQYMQFSKLANQYGFFFVAPDGTRETEGDRNRFWNATNACCNFQGSSVDDSAYVLNIINNIKAEHNIDPNRVYLIGHSNGGFMSYRAAHDHSETIAAIASVAGASFAANRPAPANPVHVLQIHGTDDGTIAYEGSDIGGNDYPSAETTVSRWAEFNGCTMESRVGANRDLEARLEGAESSVLIWDAGCKTGGSAELWTIDQGSHVPAISASFSQQVVEWLLAHPKAG